MISAPIVLIVSLVVLLVGCRPYLEARRPYASLVFIIGAALGPSVGSTIPPELTSALDAVTAILAGWLVLLAAESWDIGSMLEGRALRLLLLAVTAGLVVGGLTVLGPVALGEASLAAMVLPAALLACAAVAVDPSAAREALARDTRPGIEARRAPTLASLVLGAALLMTAPVAGLQTAPGGGESVGLAAVLGHTILTVLLGIGLGLFFVGPLRLAEGKGMLLALVLSMPVLGWGAAAALEMSPLAVVFTAGLVLANDTRRRDMIFTILKELERPFTVCLLMLSGVTLTLGSDLLGGGAFWIMAIVFTLSRPLALSLVSNAGLGPSATLPLSPLAIPLALSMMPGSGRVSGIIAVAFVASEAAWALRLRRTAMARS